jgi:pimeloyl-ACP methyl ester carboxylesterase
VDSVGAGIEDAGLNDIVIVGHSMAGLTVPGVVTKLGGSRVREMVFAAACVPADGSAMVDVVAKWTALAVRCKAKKGHRTRFPRRWRDLSSSMVFRARDANRWWVVSIRSRRKSRWRKVSRGNVPQDVPRTWILTLRDRTHSINEQRASIEAIGGVQTLIEIDTCHCLMVSEPERLASILVERCRLYA